MNYDNEIAIKQLQSRLEGQKSARFECEAQILSHKKEIQRYEETIISLDLEIKKSEQMILDKQKEVKK